MNLDDTNALVWDRLRAGMRADDRRASLRWKRLLDVALASVLLLAAAPLLLVLMIGVRLCSPGQALFQQTRVGYRRHAFRMLKLRTMVDGAEELEGGIGAATPGGIFFKPRHDGRVTPLGRWLRRSSMDELPQLWNVLRGDMSLVGPRPLLPRDLERLPRWGQTRRFSMPPGLTGLWQVSGRSLCSDLERWRLDLEYVDRWSLWLDLEILARTVPAVLSGRGAT